MQRGPRAWGCSSPWCQALGLTLEHPAQREGALSVQMGLAAEPVCSHTFLFPPPKHLQRGLISMSTLNRKATPMFESPGWEATGALGFLWRSMQLWQRSALLLSANASLAA